uniref:Uncharacterized protein n=1 Tax=Arundo donax TaxID=35708 RepID=A0A0A8Z9N9_ARUDO
MVSWVLNNSIKSSSINGKLWHIYNSNIFVWYYGPCMYMQIVGTN